MAVVPTQEVKEKHALSAYGPNGVVLAQSWDGGQTWKGTKTFKKEAIPREFTRRIGAVINHPTPSTERRVVTPYEVIHHLGIMAGWAPFDTFVESGNLDAVLLPDPFWTREDITQLRSMTPRIFIDYEPHKGLTQEQQEAFLDLMQVVDAVTVPTSMLASRLRPYHNHILVSPHALRRRLWTGLGRTQTDKTVIGLPLGMDDAFVNVIDFITKRYGELIEFRIFDWFDVHPSDEPQLYLDLDIVLLQPPRDRWLASSGPILPAMAAGCLVIADRNWPMIRHDYDGYVIGRHEMRTWLETVNRFINDKRNRARLGRNARTTASKYTAEALTTQISLPYRIMIPEGAVVLT